MKSEAFAISLASTRACPICWALAPSGTVTSTVVPGWTRSVDEQPRLQEGTAMSRTIAMTTAMTIAISVGPCGTFDRGLMYEVS